MDLAISQYKESPKCKKIIVKAKKKCAYNFKNRTNFQSGFLQFAFPIVLYTALLLEANRSAVTVYFPQMTTFLESFTDSRDGDSCILTHVYLLIGCLYPFQTTQIYESRFLVSLKSSEMGRLKGTSKLSRKRFRKKTNLGLKKLVCADESFVRLFGFRRLKRSWFQRTFSKVKRFWRSNILKFLVGGMKQGARIEIFDLVLESSVVTQNLGFITGKIQNLFILKISGIVLLCVGDSMVSRDNRIWGVYNYEILAEGWDCREFIDLAYMKSLIR